MFPLGSVLVPTAVLPLHVFEPRYRQLTKDCLAGDGEFGVVLIERGSEVGGGDVRGDVGTVAKIVESAEMDDGRFALIAVGVRRIKVVRWLADDPYPLAEVDDFPDGDDVEADLAVTVDATIGPLRRLLALRSEMGEPAAPATVDIDDDPHVAGFQLAALAPVGPADRQRLLTAPTMTERVRLVAELVDEQLDDAARRLELDAGE
jgi:Lon protease-like protein